MRREEEPDDRAGVDPFFGRRIGGLDASTRYYDAIRGQVHVERFEIQHPS